VVPTCSHYPREISNREPGNETQRESYWFVKLNMSLVSPTFFVPFSVFFGVAFGAFVFFASAMSFSL
jgi:hypothetical protein